MKNRHRVTQVVSKLYPLTGGGRKILKAGCDVIAANVGVGAQRMAHHALNLRGALLHVVH